MVACVTTHCQSCCSASRRIITTPGMCRDVPGLSPTLYTTLLHALSQMPCVTPSTLGHVLDSVALVLGQ